jgi:hypothetical protein
MVWDWNNNLGDVEVPHAGLGYSHAPHVGGPWTRSPKPLNDAVNNMPGVSGRSASRFYSRAPLAVNALRCTPEHLM